MEQLLQGLPVSGHLFRRSEACRRTRRTCRRLLYDEQQLVLVFRSEGGAIGPLHVQRPRFGRGGFVAAAMRTGARFIPVYGVVGGGGGDTMLTPHGPGTP